VQEREGNKIKASIDTFTLATKVAQKDFGEHLFNKYETGVDGAYEDIIKVKKTLWEKDKEMKMLIDYATVFEFPELTEEANANMKQLHVDLNCMMQVEA